MSQFRKLLFQHPAHFCSLGFGSGLLPKAPGTYGTLAGLPILYLLWQTSFLTTLILTILGFLWGIWCTDKTAKAMGVDDPGAIVWDEIIGVIVAGLPLFILEIKPSLSFYCLNLFIVFGLFRLFDIAKPFPVSWADKTFHGGFGIMLDDIFAGLLASLAFFFYLKIF